MFKHKITTIIAAFGFAFCNKYAAPQGVIMDPKIEQELIKNLEMKCVTEAESQPPLDPQADEWFKKARRIQKKQESGTIEEVIELYEKAIQRKHWKAYTNLAGMYLGGARVFWLTGDHWDQNQDSKRSRGIRLVLYWQQDSRLRRQSRQSSGGL